MTTTTRTLMYLTILFTVIMIQNGQCVPASRIRRQQNQQGFVWTDDSSASPSRRPTTTTASPASDAGTTTTASPQFRSCVSSCSTTPEYNPVCGSNRISYDNEGKLNCANRCGANVRKMFGGTCSAL